MADKQFDCIYENQDYAITCYYTSIHFDAGFLVSAGSGNYQ